MTTLSRIHEIQSSAFGVQIARFVFPFCRILTPAGANNVLDRYPVLFKRMIFASSKAWERFCANDRLLSRLNKRLKKKGRVAFDTAFGEGFTVRRIGNKAQYFALVLAGENMDQFMREFYGLKVSPNASLRKIFEMAISIMKRDPED